MLSHSICQLSCSSFYCPFSYITSFSYICHYFSSLFLHLSFDSTKVTRLFCTVITWLFSYCLLFSFQPVGRASYSHSRGGLQMRLSVWPCRELSQVAGFACYPVCSRLLPEYSIPVVVHTTGPGGGLIPILWGCSTPLFPTSPISLPCVVVSSLVVLLAQTLQYTDPGSRFAPVLYSVSRSINLIPNPNPLLFQFLNPPAVFTLYLNNLGWTCLPVLHENILQPLSLQKHNQLRSIESKSPELLQICTSGLLTDHLPEMNCHAVLMAPAADQARCFSWSCGVFGWGRKCLCRESFDPRHTTCMPYPDPGLTAEQQFILDLDSKCLCGESFDPRHTTCMPYPDPGLTAEQQFILDLDSKLLDPGVKYLIVHFLLN